MDEYILKKCSFGTGTYFYYKNGLLHREAGPAIVSAYNISRIKPNKYPHLNDSHLYKQEIVNEIAPKNYIGIQITEEGQQGLCHEITDAVYYLEGEPYTKKQFEKVKEKLDLKNQLNVELPITQQIIKKTKV